MCSLTRFAWAVFLTTFLAMPVTASAPAAAIEVAERYLSALQSGDTTSLSQLTGGNLRARMSGLLNNPDYSLQLVNDNASRALTIIDSRAADGGIAEVDVQLSDGEETIRKRIYLQISRRTGSAYQVIEEQILP